MTPSTFGSLNDTGLKQLLPPCHSQMLSTGFKGGICHLRDPDFWPHLVPINHRTVASDLSFTLWRILQQQLLMEAMVALRSFSMFGKLLGSDGFILST